MLMFNSIYFSESFKCLEGLAECLLLAFPINLAEERFCLASAPSIIDIFCEGEGRIHFALVGYLFFSPPLLNYLE